MDSPERFRNSGKKNLEVDTDDKNDRLRDGNDWESDDKRKHRSSKSRKHGVSEEAESMDGSGKKRNTENRKRSGGTSRGDSDEDGYEARKESRSKQMKKKVEENTLEKLSHWYEEEHPESKYESGSRGYSQTDETEKRRSTSRLSDHGGSQIRTTDIDGALHDDDPEKALEKDSCYSERSEISREKGRGSSEHGRHARRRWDESDSKYLEESDVGTEEPTDSRLDSARERNEALKPELAESKIRMSNSDSDRGIKSQEEEKRDESERVNIDSLDDPEEDVKGSLLTGSLKERIEEHRHQKNSSGGDVTDSREKSLNADNYGNSWARGKGRRETDALNRSRTPDRDGRRHFEQENLDMDDERSYPVRRKEHERDANREDKLKGRDDGWIDRNRDREGSRDNWRKRQANNVDREIKEVDAAYESGRDWDSTRRAWPDNERPQSRSGGRKDGNRTEAVKTSSNYGISNENYDVIEIQTKPFDYGKEDFRSGFARNGEVRQRSNALAPNGEDSPRHGEERARDSNEFTHFGEDSKDRLIDGGYKGGLPSRASGGPSSNGSQPPLGSQDQSSFMRSGSQGAKGNRIGRGGRGRSTGRDGQPIGLPLPMMGSPFGPLGMPPPEALQSTMSPAPGPPMSPGVFMPPFQPPVLWPGGRGVEMNMLGVPPVMSPVPPGPSGPRFRPSMGAPPTPPPYLSQIGSIRGPPPNMPGPNFSPSLPAGRGHSQDKVTGGWVPNRSHGPPGKAPSRGEQNDYSQNFVDTGMRPQNFIRELELTSVVEDYPKLRELIQKKDEIVAKAATPPMYLKFDLREQVLSPELFGTKFDVILIDPPWEEYVHRAPGVTDHMEYWTFEEIMNLKIEAIADTPSFIFLWVGDGVGLEQGRQCLKKWGFRRCEDICWVKTNKSTATPGLRHDSHTLFQRSKEHCLMGIKGTVRRSTDGHIIHANIDTDVIIAEEPPYGSTAKPEDMYRIIEHFALGRRRLELFGEDHNIRTGWLTVGKGLSSSNFNAEAYCRNFSDKDGKVWQGGGGRNPPPETAHLVQTTPEIESLRPKSPMKNQQQTSSISLTPGNSSAMRATGNSPQNPNAPNMMNQEASASNMSTPAHWGSSAEGFKGREGGHGGPDDRVFDMYGYNAAFGQTSADFMEAQRAMNML